MPVCARAAVFFVSACVRSVLMCGCLYVHSLLSAVRLSLETLFDIFEKIYLYRQSLVECGASRSRCNILAQSFLILLRLLRC